MSVVMDKPEDSEALRYFADIVRRRSAIVLEESKAYLIRARLDPIAKIHGCASLNDFARHVRARASDLSLQAEIVDAMTTNETSFFRDLHPFTLFREKILPDILARRAAQKTLRIWCAASSSGQEPYTLAIILREYFPQLNDWKIDLVASDISLSMLRRCKEGVYSQLEVNRGLPAQMMVKYFATENGGWRIREALRNMIDFKEVNLIEPWPLMPPMDIVFIRNVLIYFDMTEKRNILARMRKQMAPDGYLFLGTAETTFSVDENFTRVSIGSATCYTLQKEARV